jgi:hypothetical protein
MISPCARSSRRPLRTHQRTRHHRQIADHHQQPSPRRLVSTVPQPRRRRIPTRPTHQHQPPTARRRTQLPTPARRLDNRTTTAVEQAPRATPGEIPDQDPWGIAWSEPVKSTETIRGGEWGLTWLCFDRGRGAVDPGSAGQLGCLGSAALESFRVSSEGCVEDDLAVISDAFPGAVVNRSWCV